MDVFQGSGPHLIDDLVPGGVGGLHELVDVLLPPLGLRLRVDHLPHRLVEDVDLVRLQVLDRVVQPAEEVHEEGLRLPHLHGAAGGEEGECLKMSYIRNITHIVIL